MQQVVRVQKCNADGTAQVLHIPSNACWGDCHKCSGCGAVQEKLLLTAKNPIGAKPGAVVTIRSQTGPVLAAAAMLCGLPFVLFFLGYALFATWEQGALGGCLAFVLGVILAVVYDRRVAGKKKVMYTIIGYPRQMPEDPQKRG